MYVHLYKCSAVGLEVPRLQEVPLCQMGLYAWPAGPAGAFVRLSCHSPGATWTPKVTQTAVLALCKVPLGCQKCSKLSSSPCPSALWAPNVLETDMFALSQCNLNAKSAPNCQVGFAQLQLQWQLELVQVQLDYRWHLNSKLHWSLGILSSKVNWYANSNRAGEDWTIPTELQGQQ